MQLIFTFADALSHRTPLPAASHRTLEEVQTPAAVYAGAVNPDRGRGRRGPKALGTYPSLGRGHVYDIVGLNLQKDMLTVCATLLPCHTDGNDGAPARR